LDEWIDNIEFVINLVVYNSVAETEDESVGIDTQHLQTLEKLKQSQRLEHQKVRCCHIR